MTFSKKSSSVSWPMISILPSATASSKSQVLKPVKMSIASICFAMASALWGGSCAPSDQ